MSDVRRPILITLLGVLYILGAVILVLGGVAMFVAGTSNPADMFSGETLDKILQFLADNNLSWGDFTNASGIALIVMGVISFILGIGFLKGWAIFWYLGVIFNILSIVAVVWSSISTGVVQGVAGAIVSLILLLYLFLPGVKAFFLSD